MNLSILRTFLEVYRSRSIRQASARLGITQPAASTHIQALEAQLEKPLFMRHARGVAPTAVAEELAASIGPHLDEVALSVDRIQARSNLIQGTIHIAGPAEYISAKMTGSMAGLQAAGLKCCVLLGNRARIYELIESDQVDFAVTASEPVQADLAFLPLCQEKLLLVAGRRSPLATAKGKLTQDDLMNAGWVAYDDDMPLIRTYLKALYGTTDVPRAHTTVHDLRIVRDLLISGVGISVLPDYISEEALADGDLVNLGASNAAPTNTLYLAWKRSALRHPRVVFARDHFLRAHTSER